LFVFAGCGFTWSMYCDKTPVPLVGALSSQLFGGDDCVDVSVDNGCTDEVASTCSGTMNCSSLTCGYTCQPKVSLVPGNTAFWPIIDNACPQAYQNACVYVIYATSNGCSCSTFGGKNVNCFPQQFTKNGDCNGGPG
jgi:hypothetical protein